MVFARRRRAFQDVSISPTHMTHADNNGYRSESFLRRALFEETGGMYPELVTRPDIKVFLPPIGGMTVYICMLSLPYSIPFPSLISSTTLQLVQLHIYQMKVKCSHYACTMNVGQNFSD